MDRQITASTCCYCGVGCGVLIEHDGEHILGVSGDPAHPANFGKLCSKGSTLHLTGDLAARALYPELRLGKGLARSRTDWDTALEHAANVFAASNIQIMPEDVIYVPLANAAEARKFFEFVQSITRVIYDVSVTSAINVD